MTASPDPAPSPAPSFTLADSFAPLPCASYLDGRHLSAHSAPRAEASLQLQALYAVHASIYHNPGRQGLQAFMKGAGMKPRKWVSVWLRFYPTGEIPWLLKFFKALDELISPQLVPGRRALIFPAQSSLWRPSANSPLAILPASSQRGKF